MFPIDRPDCDCFSPEDAVLSARANQGDRFAEESLVLRYSWLVRSCARPLFLLGADHEDLLQEGMVGLIKAIRDFDPLRSASFSAFAWLCIRRRMLDAIRTAAGDQHAILNGSLSLDDETQLEFPSNEGDPEALLIGQEAFEERLRRCRFTSLERQVLPLYLRGQTRREISAETGMPQKTIDNAIQRIRKKLRDNG